jgi:hypothetical protein
VDTEGTQIEVCTFRIINHSIFFVVISLIQNSVEDKTEQSVTATLWSTFKRYRERKQSSNKSDKNNETIRTEDQCLICLENLSSNKTETFPCQHTFHRVCLEEWFKTERTCPLCRKLLLFPDEFPKLM